MLTGLASACKEVHMTVRTGCVRVWVGAHASISSTFAVSLNTIELQTLLFITQTSYLPVDQLPKSYLPGSCFNESLGSRL